MLRNEALLESICEKFNGMDLHDSKLQAIHILPGKNGLTHDIDVDLKVLKYKPEGQELRDGKLSFRDCRIIRMELDLLGIQLCGGDIAAAFCEMESALKESIEGDEMRTFDLRQDEDPLADFLHFTIRLIHPGGEINIFAKDFELNA